MLSSSNLDGRRRMTLSFADLSRSAAFSERLTAADILDVLRRHFALQAEAVSQHQGVIAYIFGTSSCAFWGPPNNAEDEHALLACQAAVAQLKSLQTLRTELLPYGLSVPVGLHLGIATGEVIIGDIDAVKPSGYILLGDNVKIGQRLKHLNQYYGTHILATETTCKCAGDTIITRELDLLRIKGGLRPLPIFQILGLKGEVSEEIVRLGDLFKDALQAFRSREWDRAETFLRYGLKIVPDDPPSQLFLQRIGQMRLQPPAENWEGELT
jgi:class 3 adenylate cyclase